MEGKMKFFSPGHSALGAIVLLVLMVGLVKAEELKFPATEADIVEALSMKDGKTSYQGVEYVSDKGSVYKVIGGKRYRMRGLLDIVESDLVPKVGALINFDFDSAEIRPVSYPLLDEFGKALKGGLLDAVVTIAGHTDNKGTEEYNLKLSRQRADSVAKYLATQHGISGHRLIIKAYGERKPVGSNDKEKGRTLNRRVEFIRVE